MQGPRRLSRAGLFLCADSPFDQCFPCSNGLPHSTDFEARILGISAGFRGRKRSTGGRQRKPGWRMVLPPLIRQQRRESAAAQPGNRQRSQGISSAARESAAQASSAGLQNIGRTSLIRPAVSPGPRGGPCPPRGPSNILGSPHRFSPGRVRVCRSCIP